MAKRKTIHLKDEKSISRYLDSLAKQANRLEKEAQEESMYFFEVLLVKIEKDVVDEFSARFVRILLCHSAKVAKSKKHVGYPFESSSHLDELKKEMYRLSYDAFATTCGWLVHYYGEAKAETILRSVSNLAHRNSLPLHEIEHCDEFFSIVLDILNED